jgi:hypothetical protein
VPVRFKLIAMVFPRVSSGRPDAGCWLDGHPRLDRL